jgi:hypothetical protein
MVQGAESMGHGAKGNELRLEDKNRGRINPAKKSVSFFIKDELK